MAAAPLPAGVIEIPTNQAFTGTHHVYSVGVRIMPGLTADLPGHSCTVDTGSCGLVVPESLFYVAGDTSNGLLAGVTKGAPTTVQYEPSNVQLAGFVYGVPEVGIGPLADGSCAATCRNVSVVGISGDHPHVGMLGVGFGRTVKSDNLFLSVAGMADGTVNPSFLMTTAGIWLGHTPATLQAAYPGQAFAYQQLTALPGPGNVTPPPNSPNWQTPAVTIAIEGLGAFAGTALLDTGVNPMMLRVDDAAWQDGLIGKRVQITWPGLVTDSILSYGFTIAGYRNPDLPSSDYIIQDPQPMDPEWVQPLGQNGTTFVNTGINVIQGAMFYFDAQLGQIGFASYAG